MIRPREPRILNIDPPAKLKGTPQEQNLALLNPVNKQHLQQHPHESDTGSPHLQLRTRRPTCKSPRVMLSTSPRKPRETQSMYGIDNPDTMEYGTRCLIARRMVERGVRFVQLFMGGQPWDNHSSIRSELPKVCNRTDKPVAALIKDLKHRGMLDTTLVHWGGNRTTPGRSRKHQGRRSGPQRPRVLHVARRRRYQGGLHPRCHR